MRKTHSTIACAMLLAASQYVFAADFGRFSGNPVLSWNPDGRAMTLVEDFTYTDPHSDKWVALKDSKIDGASIPQILWSLVGGPYEGAYRNASIVHDTECTKPYKHRWQAVHEMFYFASRAGGEGWLKAKVMFAAVYHFGPRWEMNGKVPDKRTLFSTDDFFRMRSLIRRDNDISLDAIEGLTHDALVGKVSDIELAAERRCGGELNQSFMRYLDEQISRGEFVPGGSAANQGDWQNYLGCIR
jgi:hypothetical protein